MKFKELNKKLNKGLIAFMSIVLGFSSFGTASIDSLNSEPISVAEKDFNGNLSYTESNVFGVYFELNAYSTLTAIVANGAPLLVVEESSETHVYIDKNIKGVVDSGEVQLVYGATTDFSGKTVYLAKNEGCYPNESSVSFIVQQSIHHMKIVL